MFRSRTVKHEVSEHVTVCAMFANHVSHCFVRIARLVDFLKHMNFTLREVGLIIGETLFVDLIDRPLLNVPENKTIEVIFTRATNMKGIDLCFRGPKPSFEEDMRESPAASE